MDGRRFHPGGSDFPRNASRTVSWKPSSGEQRRTLDPGRAGGSPAGSAHSWPPGLGHSSRPVWVLLLTWGLPGNQVTGHRQPPYDGLRACFWNDQGCPSVGTAGVCDLYKQGISVSAQRSSWYNPRTPIHRVCVCVCVSTPPVTQSCPTLRDPMDGCLPGSSVHGILQARTLKWVPVPSSRGSFLPRD